MYSRNRHWSITYEDRQKLREYNKNKYYSMSQEDRQEMEASMKGYYRKNHFNKIKR